MAIELSIGGRVHRVTIARRRPHLVLVIDGEEHEISDAPSAGSGRNRMTIGGQHVDFARAEFGNRLYVRLGGRTYELGLVDPFSATGGAGAGANAVKAPMPGTVVSVQKQAGDPVKRGDSVVTIESMKLQTALAAPRDGVIAKILKSQGETFEKDEVIVTLEPETGKA